MTKRYLRFNRNRQKSSDDDEMVMNLEKNVGNLDIDAWGTKFPGRNNTKSASNLQQSKEVCGPADGQDIPDSFKNMKRIWKKAVFSIKKDTKNKTGANYLKSEIEMPIPTGDLSKSKSNPGDLDVDPIYLMLRSAAYKANDGNEQGTEEDKSNQPDERSERDGKTRELSNNLNTNHPDLKLSPNEDTRKILESNAALKAMSRRRLDTRMKSLSVDNPEIEIHHEESEDLDDSIYQQSRQFSNSFTNTNAIESNPYSLRKKYMKEHHRSISMENDHHPTVTSSCDNYRSSSSIKSSEIVSPRHSSRFTNVGSDESKRNSQSSGTKSNLRATRTNWKMKSFSVDVPDGDVDISASSSQYVLKASSHTSSPIRERQSFYKSSDSPGYDNCSSHSNLHPKRSTKPSHHKPITPESVRSGHQVKHNPCRYDPEFENIPIDNRRLSNNSFVVLYDFYARRSDELDLKAGWKVSVLNSSDPDWWTGRCNSRIGYFPAAYVQKIHYSDSVWKIVRDISLNDDDGNTFKLRKGEIVVQQGSQDSESIPICIKRISYLWCPIDYVGKIFDDYI